MILYNVSFLLARTLSSHIQLICNRMQRRISYKSYTRENTFPLCWLFQKSMVAFDFLKCVTRKIVTREFIFAHICARKRPEVFDDLSSTWVHDTICLLQVVRRYNNCPKTDTTQLLWQFDPRKAACAQYVCFSSFFYSTSSIRYTLMGAF